MLPCVVSQDFARIYFNKKHFMLQCGPKGNLHERQTLISRQSSQAFQIELVIILLYDSILFFNDLIKEEWLPVWQPGPVGGFRRAVFPGKLRDM